MIKTYNAEWVMQRRNRNHGLEPLRRVLNRHGNPQNQLSFIHVAGTNGKGSVCCFMKDVLKEHGCRVGFFTSPHLVEHYDRIRINDSWIPQDTYEKYLNAYLSDIMEEKLGMFEITVLIALEWFSHEKVDYVIWECGLGGRLDSTNVIETPIVDVITTIGSDHSSILGERKEQIAFEKAGIMRKGVSLCVGNVDRKAETVIRLQAYRRKVPVTFTGNIRSLSETCFAYDGDVYELSGMAQYQKENAVLAMEALKKLDIDIHDEKTHRAIVQSRWPGRFEQIHRSPDVYLDGAHNREGIQALLKNYDGLKRNVVTVFSALKDKPGKEMAEMLREKSDTLIITSIDSERFESMDSLAVGGCLEIRDEEEAVYRAMELAGKNGSVVICGSLYFISAMRRKLLSGGCHENN